ncbi:hypothetical protein PENTCL1PPCAC_700, partial [Pristionchus entomophagus]
ANDRLLFYTIKPDCSIRVATGAIPSAQFKPSNSTPCADPHVVRHGTFTDGTTPCILVMYRNPTVAAGVADDRSITPSWIVHLISINSSPFSSFSMAIGDEDYSLHQ